MISNESFFYYREQQMVQEHESNVNELKVIIQENDENNENQLAELNNLNTQVKSQINQFKNTVTNLN